jgi:hypothetical protein
MTSTPPPPVGRRRIVAAPADGTTPPSPPTPPPAAAPVPTLQKTAEEVAAELVPGVPQPWEVRGRWGDVIQSVEEIDPATMYRELVSKLKLGEHATDYGTVHRALDDAEYNAFQAGKLARAAKLEEQRVDRQCEQELEVLRSTAREKLKEAGVKKPSAQEVEDYMMRAGTGWPDLVRRLNRRKEEAHAQRATCDHLETSWRSRCNTLRVMGMKLKGIDALPEGVT